jgi:nitroimidazol reductase NimA-like FMN-containing flavoprotein (pyridoxamine 5'-phosphate oxidase superfamily)
VELPNNVRKTLEDNKVGYISVTTPSGRISTNPISYYFDDGFIYFLTPRASKRYKFMQKKPNITFTVDNGELMEKCAGIMVQGLIEPFSPTKMALSAKTILPKFMKYLKKYPEGIPFYALGTLGLNKLPDERKIYKYNFIRINPVKVFYWDGYDMGRIGAKSGEIVKDDPVLLARQALKGDFSLAEEETPGFDVLDVINLSDSMRSTALTLAMFGQASPEQIAQKTKQSISTSRANLDSLVRMGYAHKPSGEKDYFMED